MTLLTYKHIEYFTILTKTSSCNNNNTSSFKKTSTQTGCYVWVFLFEFKVITSSTIFLNLRSSFFFQNFTKVTLRNILQKSIISKLTYFFYYLTKLKQHISITKNNLFPTYVGNAMTKSITYSTQAHYYTHGNF